MEATLIAILAQGDDLGIEHPVYYLSKAMSTIEQRYTRIEKVGLTLIFSPQKLWSLDDKQVNWWTMYIMKKLKKRIKKGKW